MVQEATMNPQNPNFRISHEGEAPYQPALTTPIVPPNRRMAMLIQELMERVAQLEIRVNNLYKLMVDKQNPDPSSSKSE